MLHEVERVADRGGQLALALEALLEMGVGGQRGCDHLQRHPPLQPQVGRRDIVRNGAGEPACVIETRGVERFRLQRGRIVGSRPRLRA